MAKVIIICDFHKKSGFGHLTRMKSLANSFKKNFHQVKFIFEKKHRKFNEKYLTNFQRDYLDFNLNNNPNKLIKYLKKNQIDIVIFDSYYISINLESRLYRNFFIVSIDDRLLKHKSHLIFNSRETISEKHLSLNGQIWKTGKKYLLIGNTISKKEINSTIKKILIHAGGVSNYNYFTKFLFESLYCLKNKDLKISFLYKNREIKSKILKIINKVSLNKKKFLFIKNNQNFSKTLNKFDLIVGPSGITTYEAIASKVLPLSFSLFNDGRDDVYNWNLVGNVMHLNKSEIKNKKIIHEIWDFLFKNYSLINKNLFRKSKYIRNNSDNVYEEIIKFFKNPNKLSPNKLLINDHLKIKSAKFDHIRFFLNSRNKLSVRNMSSNPKHTITFPEHLNWWINSKIKKFVLFKQSLSPIAYHWIKSTKEFSKYPIIISGWFPDYNDKNMMKSSYVILNHQKKYLKDKYKGSKWIININKKNVFSLKLNLAIGFKKAGENIKKIAQKIFNINLKDFEIFEMKI